ncbi:hypothetical protein PhaeoP66_03233 [Phaeobacter inhibens]|uniref:Uncharacterized protein n=1 Tax=Phaeobacter inhibens TaxID=221822 RepID=A0ABM6RI65_9RHOB|nr:hypothetical protein [Phaeobacter inhibens]AUQ95975.1 hypothetical protein PhaeoP66_03233 [Phaeobacter inhibens]
MPTLDDLRVRFPHLGFGVYAYEPGAGVLLEIHMPVGMTHEIIRPSLAECIAAAFPELQDPTPETNPPSPFG